MTEALGDINGLAGAGVYAGWQDTFTTDPDTSIAIAAVSTGPGGTFSILGDYTSVIQDGGMIEVTGSSNNDGMWVVASTSFDSTNTVITVTGTVGATADGNLTWHWTGTLATMVAGVKFS